MGIRAHIIEKYVCEFAQDTGDFNYLAEEVLEMLTDHDVKIWTADENNAYCAWEINGTKELEAYIEELEKLPDGINEYVSNGGYEYTNGEVAKNLKTWMKYLDPVHNVIRVRWY